VLAMICGLAVVFTGGVSWLMIGPPRLGLSAALTAGFYPFVGADFAKLLVASGVMPALWKITGRADQR
jgi:biotin transport system substrate-specific component